MTTYELPPEPPVGLHQKYTVTRNDGRDRPGARYFVINYAADPAAMAALAAYADAVESDNPKLAADLRTLIEPDPWPTDDLIVADWIAGAAKGHGLLYLDGHEYVTVESGHVLRYGRDTLTNVVPVTVVAEWRTVRDAAYIRGSGEGDRDYWARVGRQAVYAVTATDALGLDQ